MGYAFPLSLVEGEGRGEGEISVQVEVSRVIRKEERVRLTAEARRHLAAERGCFSRYSSLNRSGIQFKRKASPTNPSLFDDNDRS